MPVMKHSTTSQKILVILAVIIVFTTLVIVALKQLMPQEQMACTSDNVAYQQGYRAARARLEQIYPELKDPIYSFSGTVVNYYQNSIVVSQETLPVDDVVDNISNDRLITLTGDGVAMENGSKVNIADIKKGDHVTVKSPDDVRTSLKIQASEIDVTPVAN